MTPELRSACELVFQEHKLSHQIKWTKDSFRGQLSIGLSELAKEILVKKNIIVLPNKSKKLITLLNPAVASASSFEEAEGMILNKPVVAAVSVIKSEPVYVRQPFPDPVTRPRHAKQMVSLGVTAVNSTAAIKWYFKPVFLYFVWPLCAIVAGALISFLLDFAYSELFLHTK